MFIDFAANKLFGAPAERNVLVMSTSNLAFRSVGAKNLLTGGIYKHSVPPGLSDLLTKHHLTANAEDKITILDPDTFPHLVDFHQMQVFEPSRKFRILTARAQQVLPPALLLPPATPQQ